MSLVRESRCLRRGLSKNLTRSGTGYPPRHIEKPIGFMFYSQLDWQETSCKGLLLADSSGDIHMQSRELTKGGL